MHPIRPLVQWYHGRIMDNYIRQGLERSFREIKAAHAADADGKRGKLKSIKSVTTLAPRSLHG